MTEPAAKRPTTYMKMREVYDRMADLGVSESSTLRMVKNGKIPGGEEAYEGRWIVRRETFEEWYANGRRKAVKVPDRRKTRRRTVKSA